MGGSRQRTIWQWRNGAWTLDVIHCLALEPIDHIELHYENSQFFLGVSLGCRCKSLKQTLLPPSSNKFRIASFLELVPKTSVSNTWPICFAALCLAALEGEKWRIFNHKMTTLQRLLAGAAEELGLWSSRSNKLETALLLWADRLMVWVFFLFLSSSFYLPA
jgi:hypothetical protein